MTLLLTQKKSRALKNGEALPGNGARRAEGRQKQREPENDSHIRPSFRKPMEKIHREGGNCHFRGVFFERKQPVTVRLRAPPDVWR